ncbi:MAG TPA: CYTH domain-containing protein [Desulfopila sp.]|nr:CYTH domain-containing protein [Desulfopila sp.]
MGLEIERKFTVVGDIWKEGATSELYVQGYLPSNGSSTLRIRQAGERAWITIKGRRDNLSRLEFEYPIPPADALLMLEKLCLTPLIRKRRYRTEYQGFVWEIDEFQGENDGLVIAEIELQSENQAFIRPPWLGREVSGDRRYYNASLSTSPYSTWAQSIG